jgi:hypothetical protein
MDVPDDAKIKAAIAGASAELASADNAYAWITAAQKLLDAGEVAEPAQVMVIEIVGPAEMTEAVEAAVTSLAPKVQAIQANNVRNFGSIRRVAMVAGAAVFADTVGTSQFPPTQTAMAKAIVHKIAERGMDKGDALLDHTSSSIKRAAGIFMDAAKLMDPLD